jgi:hypothetical protein
VYYKPNLKLKTKQNGHFLLRNPKKLAKFDGFINEIDGFINRVAQCGLRNTHNNLGTNYQILSVINKINFAIKIVYSSKANIKQSRML